jgi:hypothetical protein
LPSPDPLLWVELGIAFLGVGIAVYILGDQKSDKMSEDMDELYWKLREKRLDPLIEEIMLRRQPKEDPHKVMSLPEVADRLRKHNSLIEEYMDADEYRLVINSSLDYSCVAAFAVGVIETGFGIIVGISPSYSDFTTSNISALLLGTLFLGMFLWRYRADANKYIEAVRKVRRNCS